jgi:uncharacterized protein YndB with AHSA1/START domain
VRPATGRVDDRPFVPGGDVGPAVCGVPRAGAPPVADGAKTGSRGLASAPARALVFEAWTTPSHVRRWYGTLAVCEIDLRPGGAWHYVLRGPDGKEHGFRGEYREVVPPERLVDTEAYDVEGLRDHPSLVTITFAEHDGTTTMTSVSLYESPEYRDGQLNSGMETGMVAALDRLAELLATLRR